MYNYRKIYEDLYNDIISQIYAQGTRLPTEEELCEKYDVSRTTARRAFEMLADKGMIERISGKGTFVTCPEGKKVAPRALLGVIMCDISVSYGLGIIRSIERYASVAGYSVVYKDSNFDKAKETQAIHDLVKLGVEAIILQPLHAAMFNEAIMRLSLKNYPLILIDREMPGLNFDFVGSDNIPIVKQVIRQLFAKGHTNICFVSSSLHGTSTLTDRYSAFTSVFIEENRRNFFTNVYTDIKSTRTSRTDNTIKERDIVNLCAFFTDNPQITCVFAVEYSICILVKEALRRLGKRIPDDMSLVTFDNIYDDFFITRTSYIRQDENEIGRLAVELAADAKGNRARKMCFVPCTYVDNGSVKDISQTAQK